MDRLLTNGVGRTKAARLATDPITGFRAARQKTGVMVCGSCAKSRILQALLVVALALMWGIVVAEPVAAQGVREPIVPGVRPNPRPAPPTRITPRQPFLPAPRAMPGPGLRSGPGAAGANPRIVQPQVQGRDCYARCGSQCQATGCSGFDASQCNAMRQQCRMSCRSGCR